MLASGPPLPLRALTWNRPVAGPATKPAMGTGSDDRPTGSRPAELVDQPGTAGRHGDEAPDSARFDLDALRHDGEACLRCGRAVGGDDGHYYGCETGPPSLQDANPGRFVSPHENSVLCTGSQ